MHVYVWPYIAGLAIVAMVIMLVLNGFYDSAKRSRESFARATPATARVLKVGEATTSRSYRGVIIELLLQIQRPGAEPYNLSTLWAIEPAAVPKVQLGKTFGIKVDPEDENKLFSNETWCRSLGLMKEPIGQSGK